MFITTGLDGYSCLYSFPNKLLNVLKHPNKGYFDYILLGSNAPASITIASNTFYGVEQPSYFKLKLKSFVMTIIIGAIVSSYIALLMTKMNNGIIKALLRL